MDVLYTLIENTHITVWVTIGVCFILEMLIGRHVSLKSRVTNYIQNMALLALGMTFLFFIEGKVQIIFDWLERSKIGLFYWVTVPYSIKIIVGVFLIDHTEYWFHRLAHNNAFIWRGHRVHHGTSSLDASTGVRVHPISFVYSFISQITTTLIFGIDALSLMTYIVIVYFFYVVVHANITYPAWVDKTLGLIVFTPKLHRVHHDQDQNYTESNYGFVFTLWDRLYGTLKSKPVDEVVLGLKEWEGKKKQSILFVLISPLLSQKQIREYK